MLEALQHILEFVIPLDDRGFFRVLFMAVCYALWDQTRRVRTKVETELEECSRDRRRDHASIFALANIVMRAFGIIRMLSGEKRAVPNEFIILENDANVLFEKIKKENGFDH